MLPNGLQPMLPLLSLGDGAPNSAADTPLLRINQAGTDAVAVAQINGVSYSSGGSAPLAPAALVEAAPAWDEASFEIVVDGQAEWAVATPWSMRTWDELAVRRHIIAPSG